MTVLAQLHQEVRDIEQVVDIATFLDRPINDHTITTYYTTNQPWYRVFHSHEGSVHLALNPDGVFDPAGYMGQARIVEQHLSALGAQRVLELACGQGFNMRALARRNPAVQVVGIDLTPTHVRAAQAAVRPYRRAQVQCGDFHHLPYAAACFDVVYVVEGLCHTHDLDHTLREVGRVMRPGGRFVVFDGFRRSGFDALDPEVQRAARLAEKSMVVGNVRVLDEWLTQARRAGFDVLDVRDLSTAILPTARRLARMHTLHFRLVPLSRWVYAQAPALVINAIPCRLLPLTLQAGAHSYHQIVLERR